MGRPMGLDMGLEGTRTCWKRKFRWLFVIPSVSASGANSLPPQRSARPILSFKEMQVEHLNETLYYPTKPDYKPIQVTLFDLPVSGTHPVMRWIMRCYDASVGAWKLPVDSNFLVTANLNMYDGCGNLLETWAYENAWPQQIDFGDLDMGSSDIVTCDITLRYARAYITFSAQTSPT